LIRNTFLSPGEATNFTQIFGIFFAGVYAAFFASSFSLVAPSYPVSSVPVTFSACFSFRELPPSISLLVLLSDYIQPASP